MRTTHLYQGGERGGGGGKLQLDYRSSNSKRQINEIFFHPVSIERLLGPTSLIQNR